MADYKFLQGTGVALITPFKGGEVDYSALRTIIDHCITGGVDYLVSLGTTGESVTLSADERQRVVDVTLEHCDGRCPVAVGISGNDTAQVLTEMKQFKLAGVSAILSASPAYNKPSQEGILAHYSRLVEQSPLPIIIYNVPGRTSSNIQAETTLALAEMSDLFCAVKEASGDLVQANMILKHKPSHFEVLSGDDPLSLALIGIGGTGVISVIANAFPQTFSGLIRAALDHNWDEARQLNNKLLEIHKWLYIDGNPAGVKAAMHHLGLCENELRLPLVPMQSAHEKILLEKIRDSKAL